MRSRTALVGMAVAIALMVAMPAHSLVSASQNPPGQQKKYKATRPIVVDAQSGEVRMPTADEVADTVTNLVTLTKRTEEGLTGTTSIGGAVGVDLDGGFGGVMLARPTEDGTMETRCVFTFEEAAEFLGLVEDNQ